MPRQATGRLDAVHDRHPDVHEHHVGLCALGEGDRLGAVRRLADDIDVRLGLEDHAEAGPHQRLVVDDHDPDAAHPMPRSVGSTARSW